MSGSIFKRTRSDKFLSGVSDCTHDPCRSETTRATSKSTSLESIDLQMLNAQIFKTF